MFGRKNKREEQIKETFAQVLEYKEGCESRISSIEQCGEHMQEDVVQLLENANALVDYAMQNVEEESSVLHYIDDFSKDLQTVLEEYKQLTELVKQHHEDVVELVEENKHYTTPAKYLSEAPAVFRKEYQSYAEKMKEMAENGRRMSVMALNAAIEAGRIGEAGKQFVAISEEIRQNALGYEKTAIAMQEELEEAQKRLDEVEEFVHRFVTLIKDGNIATTRLMKKSMKLNNKVKNATERDFSEDMVSIRDHIVAMRNLDEEIGKTCERDQIQLNDVKEELLTQKNECRELESDISFLFEEVQRRNLLKYF